MAVHTDWISSLSFSRMSKFLFETTSGQPISCVKLLFQMSVTVCNLVVKVAVDTSERRQVHEWPTGNNFVSFDVLTTFYCYLNYLE